MQEVRWNFGTPNWTLYYWSAWALATYYLHQIFSRNSFSSPDMRKRAVIVVSWPTNYSYSCFHKWLTGMKTPTAWRNWLLVSKTVPLVLPRNGCTAYLIVFNFTVGYRKHLYCIEQSRSWHCVQQLFQTPSFKYTFASCCKQPLSICKFWTCASRYEGKTFPTFHIEPILSPNF